MTVSFAADILPLFTTMDVDHMKPHGVALDDYGYMSEPTHAGRVLETVSSGAMPPRDSSEPAWSQERVALLRAWIDGGYQQ